MLRITTSVAGACGALVLALCASMFVRFPSDGNAGLLLGGAIVVSVRAIGISDVLTAVPTIVPGRLRSLSLRSPDGAEGFVVVDVLRLEDVDQTQDTQSSAALRDSVWRCS